MPDAKRFALTLIALSFLVGPVEAEENATTASDSCEKPYSLALQADFYSAYMFRGQNLFDGVSIQPNLAGSYSFEELGTVGGYVWSHFSADDDVSENRRFTEIDYNLFYGNSIDIVKLEGGLIWYTYPNGDDNLPITEEFYLKAALDTILNPSLTFFHDFKEYGINFYQLNVSQKMDVPALGEGFNLTPYGVLGFASDAERVYNRDGLEQITLGVSFETKLGDISVVPNLNYNFATSKSTNNQFWAGVTFKYDI